MIDSQMRMQVSFHAKKKMLDNERKNGVIFHIKADQERTCGEKTKIRIITGEGAIKIHRDIINSGSITE